MDEAVQGLAELGAVFGDLEKEIEVAVGLGNETLELIPPLDGALLDVIDGFELLRPAVLGDLEIGNGQVVDEAVPFKDADGDFDVDDEGFLGQLLGQGQAAEQDERR